MKKLTLLALSAAAVGLTGCASLTGGKRIVRISHAQAETHPEHLGLLAFKEYVEVRSARPFSWVTPQYFMAREESFGQVG